MSQYAHSYALSRAQHGRCWPLRAPHCLLELSTISVVSTRWCAAWCSVQHGRGERLERNAVNTLRLVSALLARPAVRSNAETYRTFLPPLLRPILELLPSSGCALENLHLLNAVCLPCGS